jgi:putative dehydrogenase
MERTAGGAVIVIGNGEMGSAVAQALAAAGAQVRTSLRGRSAESRERARRAGLTVIDDDDELLRGAAFLLSVVPPGQARAVGERFAGPLKRAATPPIYADCNAVAPATTSAIGELIERSGASYVDGSIVGPPNFDRSRPSSARIFVSGPQSARLLELKGIEWIRLEGPVGAASALKMAYAGLTKGLTALGAAVIMGANRYQVAGALKTELNRSAGGILRHLSNTIPSVPRKAYRFVAEMEEIARFAGGRDTGGTIYEGTAAIYAFLAGQCGSPSEPPGSPAAELLDFFARE